MLSSEESFNEVTTSLETVELIQVADMQLTQNAGYGMIAVATGLCVSFAVAWLISILRKS